MTTRQIIEADESGRGMGDGRHAGHGFKVFRKRVREAALDFGDGLLTPGCFGPGGGLTWDEAGCTPDEFDKLIDLKGKVI